MQGHYIGTAAFIAWPSIFLWIPLLTTRFEGDAAGPDVESRDISETCLIIPCYKSAEVLARATLPAALRIFPGRQILVVANGNNERPLDNTQDVCKSFGVRHIWVPVGSKITAQFVGTCVARSFKYCLLIDDDIILPANLPLPTERLVARSACIGYTIASVAGPDGAKGTLIQQAQDIEYKLAGLNKVFQARVGSAIFPHGAISLWRRDILIEVIRTHPGFSISEDWYLGHTARVSG